MNRRGFLGGALASLAALAFHRFFQNVGPEPQVEVPCIIVDGNAAVTEDAYVGRLLTETYERSDGHSIAYKWGYGMIQEYIDGMRVPLGTLKVRLGISITPPGEDGCVTMWIDPEGGTG